MLAVMRIKKLNAGFAMLHKNSKMGWSNSFSSALGASTYHDFQIIVA